MSALDCESFDSAVESSAAILHVTMGNLLDRLRRFDHSAVPEGDRLNHPYEDLLIRHTFGIDRYDLPAPPTIHWFHATRVAPAATFDDGILPLSAVLERTWIFLGELASTWSTPAEWLSFRNNMQGQSAKQYARKLALSSNEGPFAFLVRPAIFISNDLGNHDYLGIPELVEDICLSYQEMFDRPLRERFLQATRPCVVKFRSNEPRPEALGAALMYIHMITSGQELCRECNTCYSGKGVPVAHKDILRIDWPESSRSGKSGTESQFETGRLNKAP